MHYSPYSFGLFLAQIFCLVLSPVFFAGVNYVLFSRAARSRMRYNSRQFRWTSYAFITSDIVTFLVQSAGGALFSSDNYNIVLTGGKILVAGLSLQLVSNYGWILHVDGSIWLHVVSRAQRFGGRVWEGVVSNSNCEMGFYNRNFRTVSTVLAD